ncbi:MAG: hypothetical protein KJT01_09720 [Gemmatimonadetes bacterium]|nr:hypothetical protein [Gemmatimonadota bacterium]
MTRDRAEAILYESEAALRLVDQQLDDLGIAADPRETVAALSRPLPDLSLAVEEAGAQVARCLARLRAAQVTLGRGGAGREPSAREPGARSLSALAGTDPTSALLNACERAVGLLDRLEAHAATAAAAPPTPDEAAEGTALRAALRDELFGMIGTLQFQELASSQLAQCAGLLREVEGRLVEVEAVFGGSAPQPADPDSPFGAP